MARHEIEIVCAAGLALALLVTAIAHLPALPGGLYFDDDTNIVYVMAVHWETLSLDAFARLL